MDLEEAREQIEFEDLKRAATENEVLLRQQIMNLEMQLAEQRGYVQAYKDLLDKLWDRGWCLKND